MSQRIRRLKTRYDCTDQQRNIHGRWHYLTSSNTHLNASRQFATSMNDLSVRSNGNVPGKIIRPKSMCVPDSRYIEQDDNNFFNDRNTNFDNTYYLDDDDNPEFGYRGDNILIRNQNQNRSKKINILNKEEHVHRNPVQRAASRLYRVGNDLPRNRNETICKCVGPEFVVKSSLPPKRLILRHSNANKRTVNVILLDGQKLEVFCGLRNTAAELLELIVREKQIEENFMLGLSVLISGDFVFIPPDTRMCKVINSRNNSNEDLTLYLRVRFFLPTLRGTKGCQTRHLIYLQLRRSILEHQLPSSFSQIIELNGLALQAEFGNFQELDHGMRDYFLLEHYVPETMTCTVDDETYLKEELIKAHISKKGLEREQAEESFIVFSQNLPHYGGHFYTAVWTLKNDCKKDIWLCISPQGLTLYERGKSTSCYGLQLYQTFEWKRIQTICYSKHFLYILPSSSVRQIKGIKRYKLRMDHKKSYFAFRLASVHHQFFLRLRREHTTIQSLNQEFGVELRCIQNETNPLYKLGAFRKRSFPEACGYDNITNDYSELKDDFRTPNRFILNVKSEPREYRRTKSVQDLMITKDQAVNEDQQNKDNEKPELTYQYESVMDSSVFSDLPTGSEKRRGVKMGVRAFSKISPRESRSMEIVNNQAYLDQISLGSLSLHCSSTTTSRSSLDDLQLFEGDAYVLDSTLRPVSQQNFLPNFQETINETLLERLNGMSFAEERILSAVTIERDSHGSLGLQITEGSDGNMYIQSVIEGGSAYFNKGITEGDQVIAVNGQSLLGRKYNESLEILKNTTGKVEIVISRVVATYTGATNRHSILGNISEEHLNSRSLEVSKLHYGSNISLFSRIDLDGSLPVDTQLETDCIKSYHNSDKYINRSLVEKDTLYYKNCQQRPVPQIGNFTVEENTYLGETYTNISESLPKLPNDNNKAIIVDMIPKKKVESAPYEIGTNININPILLPLKKDEYSTLLADSILGSTSVRDHSIDIRYEKKEQLVALPRSLGLSRKWRGPVRYPVTPVKKTVPLDEVVTGTSYEEQIFI